MDAQYPVFWFNDGNVIDIENLLLVVYIMDESQPDESQSLYAAFEFRVSTVLYFVFLFVDMLQQQWYE